MSSRTRIAVGLHIRTRKYGRVSVQQFVRLARMLARRHPSGSVFVASDANLFAHVAGGLPGRRVSWSNATQDALAASRLTRGNNPGTELSALLDVLLLSQCRQLVLTPASSLGAVAAALAGVPAGGGGGPPRHQVVAARCTAVATTVC